MHIDPLATAIVSGIAIVGMAAVLWPARKPKPDLKPELGEPWNHARVAKPTEEELRSRGIDPEEFFKGALTKPTYLTPEQFDKEYVAEFKAPGPASEVIALGADSIVGASGTVFRKGVAEPAAYDSVMHKLEMRSASLNRDGSVSISGTFSVADGREPMVLGEEIELPRYWVPIRPDHVGLEMSWRVHDRLLQLAHLRKDAPIYAHRRSALRAARRLNAKAELDAANGRLA